MPLALPPHFIVIGAQKSASTFVQNCLMSHPDIWMPAGETPHFEDPDYDAAGPDALQAIFRGRAESQLGIKRPNYIGKAEVPPRIARDRPDAKLLAVLRNPVDRAVSAFFHLMKSGFLPPMDPNIGLDRLLDGSLARDYPRVSEVLEFGLYHKHLRGYEPFREKGHLKLFLHEEILAQPGTCVREIYEYLGVDPTVDPGDALTRRPQAVVYNRRRLSLLRMRPLLLYRFDATRTRMIGRTRNPVKRGLAASVVAFDRLVASRILDNRKPDIDSGIRHRLFSFYQEDVASLESDYGLDLAGWRPDGRPD